jgi:hypothetical protein
VLGILHGEAEPDQIEPPEDEALEVSDVDLA